MNPGSLNVPGGCITTPTKNSLRTFKLPDGNGLMQCGNGNNKLSEEFNVRDF